MQDHLRLGPFRLDLLAALALAASLLAPPSGEAASVSGLSVSKASRSEYIAISGSGFGATQGGGLVLIDNSSAVVSTWSDARIIAYVPQTVIGHVGVQVVTANGSSNVVDLEVVEQQPVGHVRWRAKIDSDYILHRAAVGPDGTVYANAVNGKTYAWTADGGLRWVVQAGIRGGYGPVTVGADGTIYVASLLPTGPAVIALNPDGSQKWQFVDPVSNSVRAGPNVGPDGNLYVCFNTTGTAASTGFNLASLSPTGQLRWFRREGFRRTGNLGRDLVFGAGSGQLYFSLWSDAYPFGALFAYDFDGNQRFAIPPNCCSVPAVGPDENVHDMTKSYTPQGDLLWTFPSFGQGPTQNSDVGPDNVQYLVQNSYRLYAINPNGSENWHYDDSDAVNGFHLLFEPRSGPLNNLVLLGGRITFGAPGFFIAVDVATGSLAWRENLPVEPGFAPYGQVVPLSPPLFSADGLTAYIAANVAGASASPNPYSFFYALDTSGAAVPTPPAAPGSLVATAASSSQINLVWVDNSSNESGFKIERCQGVGCTSFVQVGQTGANVASYSNTGLLSGTSYGYRVRAFNGSGSSGFSSVVRATTLATPTIPATPSNLTAKAASRTRINLVWVDNSANEGGFRIERCKGSGCTSFSQIAAVGPNVRTYSNTGLSSNSAYTYRVRASNSAGNSGYSNLATAKTPR